MIYGKKWSIILKTIKIEPSSPTIDNLISWGEAQASMSESCRKKQYRNLCFDSREVTQNDIFIALTSDRDDGHRYVSAAFQSGACAAIVAKNHLHEFSVQHQDKCIVVRDPLSAIQMMATKYRQTLSLPFIAITGSNGKTTTRHFISTVLEAKYTIGKTEGNWNNHIGVPLSILKMTGKEDYAVIEFGANHEHEISVLSHIAQPDIGIITNIGYAHIGNFGTLKKTRNTKFEIVDGMDGKKGLLLLNGDDRNLKIKSQESPCKSLFFGFSSHNSIMAENIQMSALRGTTFTLGERQYTLPIFGRHFIYSALPAIYIARKFDIPEQHIVDALASIKPGVMRGSIESKSGVTFIVDCYNANPTSMDHAITLLMDVAQREKRCAIVGDMLELGKYTKPLHMQLGKKLVQSGIQKLIIVGTFSKWVLKAALDEGIQQNNVFTCLSSNQAVSIAKEIFKEGDYVLLKGSRAIKLETVFENF